ncbi:MAG: hypothetical protein HY853_03855 [Burkholderiales bacterium]|nr:hypothetical protein [Burkholderiales bacterium]
MKQGVMNLLNKYFPKAEASHLDFSPPLLRLQDSPPHPLGLDLDGDGLETVGIGSTNPILFDHDGDGISNATGWIKPDDGFLVFDRNGDGRINDGSELFGDSNPLYGANGEVTGQAADGFAALAQEDTNHDGVVNAQDANWANLRVWQDLNSDGISQADELKSLESLGIAGFQVAKTENTTLLANGNQIADLGHFIKSDGSEGTLGNVTGAMADIDLADNPFYRSFGDTIPSTPDTATLPDMQGSGALRDLREASSLSPELASALAAYSAADTKAGQMALIDGVISQWAGSTSFQTSIEKAQAQGYRLTYLIPGLSPADLSDGSFVSSSSGSGSSGGGASGVLIPPSEAELQRRAALLAQHAAITQLIGTLEKFNGLTFVNVEPTGVRTGASQFISASSGSTSSTGTISSGGGQVYVSLSSAQIDFLSRAYDALRQSVYDGLLLQTRLKPYLDAVSLTISDTGIGMDFTNVDAAFQARFDTAPAEAARDLLDLQRIAGASMNGLGWEGLTQLRGWLAEAVADPALQVELMPALAEFGYPSLRTDGVGGSGNDVVIGSDSGAVLNGGAGNDLVLGGAGDDVLNGGAGNDTLYGGAGTDSYVFNLGDGVDTIIETQGGAGTDALTFGPGILAGDLDIYMDGDKLVFAHGNGRDRLGIANWFGSLNEAAHRLDSVSFADGQTLDLAALQLGTSGNDTLTGTGANDILAGGAGDDILIGEAGDDLLNGGSGADQMSGGLGDDTYVVDNALDTVIEAADEGVDTVQARVSHTLADNVENLTLVGTLGISGTGNELDNVLTGNAGSNALYGLDGSDTLLGGAGNDWLDGGAGADIMAGGSGNDAYVVDSLDDTVTELAGQGTDTVHTGLSYTLGSHVENLTLTGPSTGSGQASGAINGTGNELNNVLTGNAADNTLHGLAGDDTLDGGAGADTLLGGIGNDTYVVDNVGDLVTENAAEGTDLVQSSINYTLTDNVENLTLTGPSTGSGQASGAIDGTGNELNNVLTGNAADNTLHGLAGGDTLDGGAGADTMLGGIGNDTYVVDNAGDAVIELAGEGVDTVRSAIDYTLGDNVENLTLTGGHINGTGNEQGNVLTGSSGNNTLGGGLGADTMIGGGGNDSYLIDNLGDSIIEQSGQGIDTVISPFDYTLAANVDNLTLTGVALNGTGNVLDNVIIGTDADNTLIGLEGKDTLDGGAGADNLIGGQGDDTYVVDSLLDTPTELAGEGVDTVQSNLTWTLGANLDNLTLTGPSTGSGQAAANIDGTGNELNNIIVGNSGTNTLTGLDGDDALDGGLGADAMHGGTGNDTYVVDNVGDLVTENAAEGTDLVQSSINYTLTDNVENLTLTGPSAASGLTPANTSGTGNALDNIIIGNRGNNTLTGLEGNDTLNGGEGAISSERGMCSAGNLDRLRAASNKGGRMLKKNRMRKPIVCRRSYSLVRYEYSSNMTPHRRRPLRARDVPANAQVGGREVAMQDLTLRTAPGMQVVAEINQGKRTVLEYLLSPVQKALQESGRER